MIIYEVVPKFVLSGEGMWGRAKGKGHKKDVSLKGRFSRGG